MMKYLLVLIVLCSATGCDNKPAKPQETQVIRVETPEQAGIKQSADDVQYDDTEETE